MGGINIYCGSFSGMDKSGSALQGVLAEIVDLASASETEVIDRLKAAIDEALDHVLISPEDSQVLLPLLRRYDAQVDARLAVPGDPLDQMAREEADPIADRTTLKYGAGLGWRAYCTRDLIKAFEVSDAESEPVALVW